MTEWPSTRAEALRCGAHYYFTGKLCKFGHVDVRATKNKRCRSCNQMHARNYAAKFPERKRAADRAAYRKNAADRIEAAIEYGRKWRVENRGKARAIVARYRAQKGITHARMG